VYKKTDYIYTMASSSEEKSARYYFLSNALERVGVILRDDSIVCADFIDKGFDADVGNLADVIRLMCEAKYLHEYCNYALGYQMALGVLKYNGSRYPQKQWFEVVRRCVLLTCGDGRFPSRWPWQSGITPQAWHDLFDRTQSISKPQQY
jgi:hypothetical protein